MNARVYMDWNATAPLRPEARDAMIAAMDAVGNPSSVHAEGRVAKGIIEKARGQVAELAGCSRDEIVFTSGATEAANLILDSMVVYSSKIEHSCLSDQDTMIRFYINQDGLIKFTRDYAEQMVKTGFGSDTLFFPSANSETGIVNATFENVKYYREMADELECEQYTIASDLTQMIGKVPVALNWMDLELALMSGHKIGSGKGVGALYIRNGVDMVTQSGGGQEQGRRSGTENVIGIAGFGAAAEASARDLANGVWDEVAELRDYLEARIVEVAPEAVIFGQQVKRLPNTSNFAVSGWKGETQVMQMDLAGYAISAGSACSSGKVKVSRVLQAMGFDDITASSAIRVSLGPTNTKDQIDGFVSAWGKFYTKFRAKAA